MFRLYVEFDAENLSWDFIMSRFVVTTACDKSITFFYTDSNDSDEEKVFFDLELILTENGEVIRTEDIIQAFTYT